MNFTNFKSEVKQVVSNFYAGICEAYINGASEGVFTYNNENLSVTYGNNAWSYSFRGCIGRGCTLASAIENEQKLYSDFMLSLAA